MSKHTPGPWEWLGPNQLWGGERANEEVLKAGDDGKPYGLHSPLIEHHWDGAQAKANAALIAAAPDLLEALKAMCQEFRALDLPYGSDAYTQATSALNKARGEA